MIPVSIIGTPMTFTIDETLTAMQNNEEAVYKAGKVVMHEAIGPLRCEDVSVSKEDVMRIQSIRCSIMDHKTKQSTK
jgi:hypothetical protein